MQNFLVFPVTQSPLHAHGFPISSPHPGLPRLIGLNGPGAKGRCRPVAMPVPFSIGICPTAVWEPAVSQDIWCLSLGFNWDVWAAAAVGAKYPYFSGVPASAPAGNPEKAPHNLPLLPKLLFSSFAAVCPSSSSLNAKQAALDAGAHNQISGQVAAGQQSNDCRLTGLVCTSCFTP